MKNVGRTVVLIDGANIYHAVKSLGFQIDWKRLRNHFSEKMDVLRFFYYTAVAKGEDWMFRLADWLQFNGYTVRSKPAKARGESWKGNMDVEIAVDALALADRYDHAILFSGDGDLRCLVEALQWKGIKVTVCHTQKGGEQAPAPELIKQADEFIDLADLRPHIEVVGPAESPAESNG